MILNSALTFRDWLIVTGTLTTMQFASRLIRCIR